MYSQRSPPTSRYQPPTTMNTDYAVVPQATADMINAQQNYQQSEFESEETARYSVDQTANHNKKGLAAQHAAAETGGAADRFKLTQIENAIDALLAE